MSPFMILSPLKLILYRPQTPIDVYNRGHFCLQLIMQTPVLFAETAAAYLEFKHI